MDVESVGKGWETKGEEEKQLKVLIFYSLILTIEY